ncbi:uncharacterized protein HKW66_Vig0226140 [Vigna angularis]|uniref:Uncharacterized protein n=1 Tax=Phaseolus angularis TaxID=3914 RepID=A0A8T0JYN9_PHAAN|nr:uncharacterized protein HKW66_Vig0226140 [Vigna angularis]
MTNALKVSRSLNCMLRFSEYSFCFVWVFILNLILTWACDDSSRRGLSNHFMGKSKSFTDLSQVNTVKELQKQENPFNKRRRVQIASKWSRRSSFYTWANPKSMPLLPLLEDEDFYQDNPKKLSPSSSSSSSSLEKKHQDQLTETQQRQPKSYVDRMRHKFGSFKSRSLSDLKEHDEDDEDDDNDDDD